MDLSGENWMEAFYFMSTDTYSHYYTAIAHCAMKR